MYWPWRLVIEAHARLVHEDHVLVVAHGKAAGTRKVEDRAPRLPLQISIAILAADPARLGQPIAKFSHLVVRTPERSAYGDGRQLSAGVLEGVGLAGHAVVFLGQSDVEDSAEVHVAAGTAGGEDDALARANVQGLTLTGGLDAQNPSRCSPCRTRLAILCFKRICTSAFRGRRFERPHQPNSGRGGRRNAGVHRLSGLHHRPRHGSGVVLPQGGVSGGDSALIVGRFFDNVTPCATSHSNVGALLSAKARMISLSL